MTQNQVFGYADRLHINPGQTINFHVSSEGDEHFSASLVRIVNGCVDGESNTYQEIPILSDFEGEYTGRQKAVYAGSYAEIDLANSFANADAHTVQLHIYPTKLRGGGQQTIVCLEGKDGQTIEIGFEDARLSARLNSLQGQTKLTLTEPLTEERWHLLALSWSTEQGPATFRSWCLENRFHQPTRMKYCEDTQECHALNLGDDVSIYLAATVAEPDRNGQTIVRDCFDGKIDALRIAREFLSKDNVIAAADFAPNQSIQASLSGIFNFSTSTTVSFYNELSHEQKGTFVNLPLLGVRGVRWDGSVHNFEGATDHYSAVYFHSDDLYDCGWSRDFSFEIPDDLKSGYYATKIANGEGETDYIPFFVSPRASAKKRAPIALWLPTMTYLAYSNDRMADNSEKYGFDVAGWNDQIEPDMEGYAKLLAHPEFGSSIYDYHEDGCGRHFSSWLRPIVNMRPKSSLWGMTADTLIISWLEHFGFDYDIITDHMVHEEGAELLNKYATVISGNHPEYVSSEILDAVSTYTNDLGGRFIYMGGNGYYWVTGVDSNYPAAVEVRRGVGGSGAWFSYPGEHYLQSTGQLGGLWRHVGRPPQEIFGVGTRGMGFPGSIGFTRNPEWDDPRAEFLTKGITEECLGDYGIMGKGAAGEEIDAVDYELGTPTHALVIASSQNHPRGMMIAREDLRFVIPDEWVHSQVRADITFFETASGGAVLSLSSMTWCGSLSHNNFNNGISQLTENAVRRFSKPEPFRLPSI